MSTAFDFSFNARREPPQEVRLPRVRSQPVQSRPPSTTRSLTTPLLRVAPPMPQSVDSNKRSRCNSLGNPARSTTSRPRPAKPTSAGRYCESSPMYKWAPMPRFRALVPTAAPPHTRTHPHRRSEPRCGTTMRPVRRQFLRPALALRKANVYCDLRGGIFFPHPGSYGG